MNSESMDIVSFLSFMLILYFLSELSKRLGEVLGLKRYYYLYYLGMFFMILAAVAITGLPSTENPLLLGYVLFSLGLTLGLLASIKYWGWLLKELIKG